MEPVDDRESSTLSIGDVGEVMLNSGAHKMNNLPNNIVKVSLLLKFIIGSLKQIIDFGSNHDEHVFSSCSIIQGIVIRFNINCHVVLGHSFVTTIIFSTVRLTSQECRFPHLMN
ncbi:hypothetical protein L6452_02623 [Arctium lappa]|uniref:Uncharacterized protein n=1 Tax=Arctium lappa TaxID=4217 RepID=A0ACB9FJF6_ARCLA|nr:hypothetical protein L6452_02623 [Arctium lappa]